MPLAWKKNGYWSAMLSKVLSYVSSLRAVVQENNYSLSDDLQIAFDRAVEGKEWDAVIDICASIQAIKYIYKGQIMA